MDPLGDEIDARIRALEAEIENLPLSKLLSSLRLVRERHLQNLEELRRLRQEVSPHLKVPAAQYAAQKPGITAPKRASPKAAIVATCLKIIGEYGKPIPLNVLAEELKKRGITIGGTNERTNLASKLSTATEVSFLKGQGWWLPGRSWEDLADKTHTLNGEGPGCDRVQQQVRPCYSWPSSNGESHERY